ncbi:hypothetical protein [Nesterenkonia sp. PF2B19]|uniref:hypothetical protein n=1 Tax=Nesterenkonia sp. PF2B19 TaxID=1881858 RepID=UPI000872B58C|nr:hypothetical protein [Nesterenkonia sp. PF2B19]OSM43493.1 hypothetical protein BCY76_008215 [Nesterenkonia sp. PF2B19]
MSEYRIDYTIHRIDPDSGESEEIGFGASGASSGIPEAAHVISSDLDTGSWETEPHQPCPDEVLTEETA